MYTLYYAPGSANLVVHLALIEAGATYTLKRIDIEKGEQRSADYLAINPHGVVPTLIVDGVPCMEAAALAALVAERHPDARLAPLPGEPLRPKHLEWMAYLANTLQPLFRQWFFPSDHLPHEADAIRQNARIGIEKCFAYIDGELAARGPNLLGAQVTLVDFYVLMLMRWSRNMPRPATQWPELRALAARLKARPSWPRVCEEEGLSGW